MTQVYNPDAIWPQVLEAIANGAALSTALTRAEPSPSYAWAKLQLRNNHELKAAYQQAVGDRADRLAEELMELADTPMPKGLDGPSKSAWVQQMRLRVDVRKWAASKLKPKSYGERLDLSVTQEPISITNALRVAEQRVLDDKRTVEWGLRRRF
jgi:hypothetical protein